MSNECVMNIAKYIDHTALKATTTKQDIEKLCEEAREYGFASVCVNAYYVPLAKKLLAGSDVKVCTVIGFPLGATTKEAKANEAVKAVADGANEVDMGYTPMESIMSATKINAQILDLDNEIGTIETGKKANLIVVKGDPSKDIKVLCNPDNIKLILLDGKIVKNII